ncbi:MAG: 4-hydroxy-3-methylbut-2-enyl diphosphate reductase [Lentisphaerae bacterium]|nr:4-hydroxy-3-methylbut-2-enyl diphosphate reductase [Lentisphaerota bacterium]
MVYFIAMDRKIYLTAGIFGMCGGVHAALKTLEDLVDSSAGQGISVFRELVHNRTVTAAFETRGVTFAENIHDIPAGSTLVIGAHGVSPEVERALRERAAVCLDATCPLVKKLHRIAAGLDADEELIIFGKKSHPEVQGVSGHAATSHLFIISSADEAEKLPLLSRPVFISQTTVDHREVNAALEVLKKRFPYIRICSGICDASQKRQEAVMELAAQVDAVLVIGSAHSSNAKRLREIAERSGAAAFLIDSAADLTGGMLAFDRIGVTSGASTPQSLFDGVLAALENAGFVNGKKLEA